ncbi:hydroxymethylglutaryl-CoA synthase [Streptococcus fryi]
MTSIGIDKIGFATSQYVLNMSEFATARGVDLAKFTSGLMIDAFSVLPANEDIVTLGASAAESILTDDDKSKIDMVIVATESSIDQSKAASVYIHGMLGIQPFARTFEVKEACYSATAALDYAKLHVAQSPDSRVLVVASDIAKYGIKTGGESTQGSGSVAMLVTANPRILEFGDQKLAQTRDVMDFWRPNYSETPYVDGAFSTEQYLDTLDTTWAEYQKRYQTTLSDFAAFCFHIPFPKQALKGLNNMLDEVESQDKKDSLLKEFHHSVAYSRKIGNIYTGSLYLGLLSLLENSDSLKAGDNIGFFSYGSGAVCEIFQGKLVEGYKEQLEQNRTEKLDNRTALTITEYEDMFFETITVDENGNAETPDYKTGNFALVSVDQHQRQYKKVH